MAPLLRRLCCLPITVALGIVVAQPLEERDAVKPVDYIIVLSGNEFDQRLATAEAYGLGAEILIAGPALERYPSYRGQSRSWRTKEDAEFTCSMVSGKVMIVTSSWHSARALRHFRRYGPEIEFISCPFEDPGATLGTLALERLKTALFW